MVLTNFRRESQEIFGIPTAYFRWCSQGVFGDPGKHVPGISATCFRFPAACFEVSATCIRRVIVYASGEPITKFRSEPPGLDVLDFRCICERFSGLNAASSRVVTSSDL